MTPTLAERLLAGDPRAIARAISLIEDEDPSGGDLVRAIFGRTGRAYLVGVTGPPGAGKSTLVDRLITNIRTQRPQSPQSKENQNLSADSARSAFPSVGVIAVDPTSPFSGGAVLGDRLRMQAHASDEGVFIRSMATRGHLGGLARATGDAALVLDAASPVARARPPRCPRVAMLRMNTPSSAAWVCMRSRSPRTAPPRNGLVGSTAMTPTVGPSVFELCAICGL